MARQDADRVSADAEKGRMAETDQRAVAENEIERHGREPRIITRVRSDRTYPSAPDAEARSGAGRQYGKQDDGHEFEPPAEGQGRS